MTAMPTRFPAGAVTMLDITLDIGAFVAQFVPVPALAPVLGAVQGIVEACSKIHSNRLETKQLETRCKFFVLALSDEIEKIQDTSVAQMVTDCTTHLNEVLTEVLRFTRYGSWESLLHLQEISDGLRKCNTKIDECCREFEIRSHVRLHQWHNDFEVARKADHAKLDKLLSGLSEDNDVTHQALAAIEGQTGFILELLQTHLSIATRDSNQYQTLEQNLYQVQKRSGDLPPRTDLKAGEARRIGKFPVGGNAAFDIWEGTWLGNEKVALKILRGVPVAPDTEKRFDREVKIWRDVWKLDRGRYILPFWGACYDDGPYPYMVSPWMINGDLTQYLEKHPTANRRKIIKGIAEGLSLLHNMEPQSIAHGDVKASNILMNDSGQPLLADFGLSKILEDITGVPFTQSKGVSESYRWFAPELCAGPAVLSTHSDVFAYAMTVVEVMTGQPPFSHIRRTTEVLIEMQKGERPLKPTDEVIKSRGLDDHLWNVLELCWVADPKDRLAIDQVLAQL